MIWEQQITEVTLPIKRICNNAATETASTLDHKLEGVQDKKVAHVTTIEARRISQQSELKWWPSNRTGTGEFKKLGRNRLTPSTHGDEPCTRRKDRSEISKKTSQLQRVVKLRDGLKEIGHKQLETMQKFRLTNKKAKNEFRQKQFTTMKKFFLMNKKAMTKFRDKKFQKMTKFRFMTKRQRSSSTAALKLLYSNPSVWEAQNHPPIEQEVLQSFNLCWSYCLWEATLKQCLQYRCRTKPHSRRISRSRIATSYTGRQLTVLKQWDQTRI